MRCWSSKLDAWDDCALVDHFSSLTPFLLQFIVITHHFLAIVISIIIATSILMSFIRILVVILYYLITIPKPHTIKYATTTVYTAENAYNSRKLVCNKNECLPKHIQRKMSYIYTYILFLYCCCIVFIINILFARVQIHNIILILCTNGNHKHTCSIAYHTCL